MNQKLQSKKSHPSITMIRWVITLSVTIIAILHLAFPKINIDSVTITLIIIAILPWLAPLIKSLELPGGIKFDFQDLQNATSRIEAAGLLSTETSTDEVEYCFQSIDDPNLALAGLRIEIEKRLSQLVNIYGISTNRNIGVTKALRALERANVLTNEERSSLADMVGLLNAAVHGAEVDPRAASWAIDIGPKLLKSLDERISEAQEPKAY